MFGLFIVERESYEDDVATHPLHALRYAFLSCNSTLSLSLNCSSSYMLMCIY